MVAELSAKILGEILTEKEIGDVVRKVVGNASFEVIGDELRPAADEGMSGFLGDHYKATICVRVGGDEKKIHLFLKQIPMKNKPKADFIDEGNFFRREALLMKLIEEMHTPNDPHPWGIKAFHYNDFLLVMPDVTAAGYRTCHYLELLDLPHVMLVTRSIARFHAAYTNYETRKNVNGCRPYTVLHDYGDILSEFNFKDSPWLHGAAKVTVGFLDTFSTKFQDVDNLKGKLLDSFIQICASLKEYDNALNVLIHKDLWINNIMFQYKKDAPVNAVLVDYQCARYGPPAFDLMIFLYLTTSRHFRKEYEDRIFKHYFSTFWESLEDASKDRMKRLNYDYAEFLKWCEKSRCFGALEAVAIFPYVLMDPATAKNTFDNPDTYEEYLGEGRMYPVIEYARKQHKYMKRQLDVSEEFVERFVLNR